MAMTTQRRPSLFNCHVIASIDERIGSFKFSGHSTGKLPAFLYSLRRCPNNCICVYSALSRNKESRKRNLTFHLPAAVSCSPNVRLYQTDASYISFGDIYDLHCESKGMSREEPILFMGEKVRKVLRDYRQQFSKKQVSHWNLLYM